MVLLAVRPPLAVAAVLPGLFAGLHGHAHGTELPEAASPAAYARGFAVRTGLLHITDIALGLLWQWRRDRVVVRAAGGGIAMAGAAFLTGPA